MKRIAVLGAGLIGKQHIRRVVQHPGAELVVVVDPHVEQAQRALDAEGAGGARVLPELPPRLDGVDGLIVATPTPAHLQPALAGIRAGVPVLVEKPVTDTVDAAGLLLEASERAGVPVLVGHHRRHSPLLRTAAEAIGGGELGRLVAVQASALFHKPEEYFQAAPWRRSTGGGPLLINLIHEIDALRMLAGEIASVQAVSSSAVRGFEVEDTAAILLTFRSGALGTFLLSDTAVSPRSWEQTSRENRAYAHAPDEDCYHLAGTRGSLSVPTLRLRTQGEAPSWWEPLRSRTLGIVSEDPLTTQLDHFIEIVSGRASPLVTVADGLQNLRVVEAIAESIRRHAPVDIPSGSVPALR